MISCTSVFLYALWSPAWNGLTSWHSLVMSNCDVVTFPLVFVVCCLIVSIPDICPFSYFVYIGAFVILIVMSVSNMQDSLVVNLYHLYGHEYRIYIIFKRTFK